MADTQTPTGKKQQGQVAWRSRWRVRTGPQVSGILSRVLAGERILTAQEEADYWAAYGVLPKNKRPKPMGLFKSQVDAAFSLRKAVINDLQGEPVTQTLEKREINLTFTGPDTIGVKVAWDNMTVPLEQRETNGHVNGNGRGDAHKEDQT